MTEHARAALRENDRFLHFCDIVIGRTDV